MERLKDSEPTRSKRCSSAVERRKRLNAFSRRFEPPMGCLYRKSKRGPFSIGKELTIHREGLPVGTAPRPVTESSVRR